MCVCVCFFFIEDPYVPLDKGITSTPTPRVVHVDITTKSVPVNHQPPQNEVIMNPKDENRPTSFFAQPGILAGKFST